MTEQYSPHTPEEEENRPPQRQKINPELVEHRLNELQELGKKNTEVILQIKTSVTKIETGMATKKELFIITIGLLLTVGVHIGLKFLLP